MSAVLVRRRVALPGDDRVIVTDWSMSHATADAFDPGVLTISDDRTGEVYQTFQPDEWTRCSVYGEDGFEAFSFMNDTAWLSHVGSKVRRSA